MSRREQDDDYEWMIEQLGPKHRVIECKDHIQWIVQEKVGKQWRSRKYCTSAAGVHRWTGGLPGAERLADLPERFYALFLDERDGISEAISGSKATPSE